MASPEEVLSRAIPHPADSTPESRAMASRRCLEALRVNDYAIAYRSVPLTDNNYGPCPSCGVDWVHVMHGPPFAHAEERMAEDRQRIVALEEMLQAATEKLNALEAAHRESGKACG